MRYCIASTQWRRQPFRIWSRWLRRLDLGAVPVGPQFSIGGTRSQAALFNVSGRLRRSFPIDRLSA